MILRVVLIWLSLTSLGFAKQPYDDLLNFSQRQDQSLIVKVVDSDKVVLENGQRMRLIGVESAGPRAKKYANVDQRGMVIEVKEEITIPIEEQAFTFAQELMEGKRVSLEYDIESMGIDGYRYAYIYLPDGRMANTELLRMGFVRLKIIPPNIKYADRFRAAYQEAKMEKRGLQGE